MLFKKKSLEKSILNQSEYAVNVINIVLMHTTLYFILQDMFFLLYKISSVFYTDTV